MITNISEGYQWSWNLHPLWWLIFCTVPCRPTLHLLYAIGTTGYIRHILALADVP